MQGTVTAPIKCSVQIGAIGDSCLLDGLGYKYRECLSIPTLSFIDDILSVSNCDTNSIKVNALIQQKIDARQLKFGETKCHKLHVGPGEKSCPEIKVHESNIKETNEVTYLGTVISSDGLANSDIEARFSKGLSSANQVLSMVSENFSYNCF